MLVLPDEVTHWCGQHDTHLAQTETELKALLPKLAVTMRLGLLKEHESHSPLRRVGLEGDGASWWIYGEFGTHKTRFISTFPKPLQIEDLDLGLRSIVEEVKKGGIDVTHYDSDDPQAYDRVLESVANFDKAKYRALAVDSASELEKSTLAKAKSVRGGELIELPDWNPSGERFGILIRRLRWLAIAYGVQCIVTSNEDIDREYAKGSAFVKDGQKLVMQEPTSIKGLPDLAGKWAKKCCRLFDLIGHSRIVGGARPYPVISFVRESIGGGGAHWEVKDRTGKLEKYKNGLCPPDWNELWGVIKGGDYSRTPAI
jgi:hypothetical protein